MNKFLILFNIILVFTGCSNKIESHSKLVYNFGELENAIKNAQPGDEIVMANGVWKDVQIRFTGNGTEELPITIKAETYGKVFIEGKSDLKFGGDYLVVSGLYFRNGHTPSNTVIDFKITKEQVANHCRITNCVIEEFNQLERDLSDHWVEFWGRYNQMDQCYIAGKSNEGPTVRVEIKGNRNIKNYHKIINNHFGPRPRKGGPKAETIQLGDSYSSMSPGNTTIANNLFEKCNGEVEVISNKTNFNEYRNNVFYQCEGSLVMRHGNYGLIDGNYFIGDGVSENIGGIRIINTGHWITNNYFYNLKGDEFRSPLAVMNGIPKSPLNRYNQVTDVVVAYNTWVNSNSPWQFGVGSNIAQKEVLPISEIRSARPVRTVLANNIIYNEIGDNNPILAIDKIDGVDFFDNYIDNQNVDFEIMEGLKTVDFELKKIEDNVYVPIASSHLDAYKGFEFDNITQDILGNKRSTQSSVGAFNQNMLVEPQIMDKKKYGADWYSDEKSKINQKIWELSPADGDLGALLAKVAEGDIIQLTSGIYQIPNSLIINKRITIESKQNENKATIVYKGVHGTPAFEMWPKGNLNLKNIVLKGDKTQYAFASLKNNMSSLYNISVSGTEINEFDYILKAYKQSFADNITFFNTVFKNCHNGIVLSEETDDTGNYNVEFLTVDQCQFYNIEANVIDYYRGGYDESTIGGNLSLTNSSFTNCGGNEKKGILLKTRGIINVLIAKNSFKNNPVELIATLWGAKNNTQAENTMTNSGEIIVEENLELKLVY